MKTAAQGTAIPTGGKQKKISNLILAKERKNVNE